MTLKSELVTRYCLAYLSLPIIVFITGWLRLEVGILPFCLLIIALLMVLYKRGRSSSLVPIVEPCAELKISPVVLLTLMVCLFVWCLFAGQGGFVVQTYDWNWRNATFRDLITHDWPVRYDQWNRALVFYAGHWLVPALVGKLALGAIGDAQCAWRIGNIALLIWTYCGVLLVLAQLLLLLNASSSRRQLGVLLLLVFFGGCGALGTISLRFWHYVDGAPYRFSWLEFDPWWSGWYQFSSNSTCLYWVFHQTVAPWVAILLIARGVRLSDVAFILSLVLICAPLPSIGIAFFVSVLVVRCLVELTKLGKWRDAVSSVVSLQNMIGVFVVVPVVALYLSANPQCGGFSFVWSDMPCLFFVRRTLLFLFCEVGLYFLLTYKWLSNNIWWRSSLAWLCFCPLVRVAGGQPDFCMRASIPAMMILSVMCYYSYIKYKSLDLHGKQMSVLLLCMVIGALVPWREQTKYMGLLREYGFGVVVNDRIGTFDQNFDYCEGIVSNCNGKNIDNTFFL